MSLLLFAALRFQDFITYARSRANAASVVFIAKPDASSQGRGIFIFKDPSDQSQKRPAITAKTAGMVIQKYVHRPLLVDGFKFDIRIYVLVTSCDPLRAFIHRDGLARFATVPYSRPKQENNVRGQAICGLRFLFLISLTLGIEG
jgi:tubulin polyglutamylase TTLL6/13